MAFFLWAVLVIMVVGYGWYNAQYWRRRNIPGPKSKLFIGNLDWLLNVTGNPMPFQLARWTKQYGKVYGFQRGCRNALVVSDYSIAKEIFSDQFENFFGRDVNPINGDPDKKVIGHVVNSQGMRWKRLRSLITLAFTTKSLKKVYPTILDCADKTCQTVEDDMKKSSTVDVLRNFKVYTSDVIVRTAFGRNENRVFLAKLVDTVVKAFVPFKGVFFFIGWIIPPLGPFFGFVVFWATFLSYQFFANFFKQTIKDIEFRKEAKDKQYSKDGQTDFIDILVNAQSEDVVLKSIGNYNRKDSRVNKQMTKEEVVGTCIVFLVAGFETTANTLAFTFYYLAKHPEVQEKAWEEIQQHCFDEDIEFDSLNKLTYLMAIMNETLRLHPLASSFTSRRCAHTTKVAGMEIEKGTDVILDVVSMHRDKEIWGEDADEFRPERWLDSNDLVNNYFYAFGNGPRICAGMRFAHLEYKVVLIKLLRKYRVQEVPETSEAEHVHGAILSPKSVKVKLVEV